MTKPVALVDLEGVLFPEMWPFIASAIGDRNLEITTREVSDYPSLKRFSFNLKQIERKTLPH